MAGKKFDEELMLHWATDTLSGLAYMHDALKVLHRDFKLANTLYTGDRFFTTNLLQPYLLNI